MTTILLGWQGAALQLDWITTLAPEGCRFVVPRWSDDHNEWSASAPELLRLAPEAEIIVGWNFPPEVFRAATRLKMVSSAHTGVDRYDLSLFRERGITLCNTGGVNAVAVAEHAMALLLALAKRIVENDASVRRVDWVDLTPETAGTGLAGKTVAIVGAGRIGTLVARRCRAFEMTTIGVRRDVAAASDAFVLCLPLTAETEGLMGPGEFEALPKGALVVNVGRGMVVQEAAVHDALTTGTLGGFATDVWFDYANASPAGYHYHVPSRLHVHRHAKVIGSPDVASNIDGMRERMIEWAFENVREFLASARPRRAIDLSRT